VRPPVRRVRIPKIQEVEHHFRIFGVPTGEPASEELVLDFASLVKVGGDFELARLPNLHTLDGFGSLQTIANGGVTNTGVPACAVMGFYQRVYDQLDGGALADDAGSRLDAAVCAP
jgi:hypothetical protein